MHVDQARHDELAGYIDHFRVGGPRGAVGRKHGPHPPALDHHASRCDPKGLRVEDEASAQDHDPPPTASGCSGIMRGV
jgi:hypothetical protein